MKIFTAFTLLAILSVLAVLHFASAEEGLDQHHRVSRDAGCPDLKACTKKCQSEGHRTGTCKGISRTRCLCAN
uniref:Putative defensin n=1 Tax=Rhipicephalus microplus TaxID=6941 RepID=A0A6M2D2Q3_RHIMP